ncbi:MAG: cytochrome c biogenesis protein CcsA [Candidatus Xenobiia bacterium LiM19]
MTSLKIVMMLAVFGYAVSTYLFLGYFFFNFREGAKKAGLVSLVISFILVLSGFLLNLRYCATFPFLFLFIIMINGLFLSTMKKWKLTGTASFLSLFSIIILVLHYFVLMIGPSSSMILFPSPWFYLHAAAFLFTYSCFTLAAFSSVLYLYQARLLKRKSLKGAFLRLPPLKELDEASYRLMGLGLPILALGICAGSLWSHVHIGTYWSFRPGGMTAMIMATLYFVCIHIRMISRRQGVRTSLVLVISFFVMLCALVLMGHLPM